MTHNSHYGLNVVTCIILYFQDHSSGPPPKKKSKKKTASATPAPTPSGLPANFFDAGVSKKFYPQGEEPYYIESDSDEGEGPAEQKTTPTTKGGAAAAMPSGLPAGAYYNGHHSPWNEKLYSFT